MSVNQGMQFFYGSYTHPKGEVYPAGFEYIPHYSPDGFKWATTVRMHARGELLSTTSTELTVANVSTRIAEIDTAYNKNYKDFGFKLDDGTDSKHIVRSNDTFNLSGNRVKSRSWDNRSMGPWGNTEYANTRSFSITLEALFLTAESNILSWKEATEKTGTGGPVWRIRNTWNGVPYKYQISAKSKVVHVTQGEIVSLNGWATPPAPYWPNEELEEFRVINYHAPAHHGDLQTRKPTHYRMQYKYVFQRLGPSPLLGGSWLT